MSWITSRIHGWLIDWSCHLVMSEYGELITHAYV